MMSPISLLGRIWTTSGARLRASSTGPERCQARRSFITGRDLTSPTGSLVRIAAAVRVSTPSLTNIRSRCFSTVRGDVPSVSAISRFLLPMLNQPSTSHSRAVRRIVTPEPAGSPALGWRLFRPASAGNRSGFVRIDRIGCEYSFRSNS